MAHTASTNPPSPAPARPARAVFSHDLLALAALGLVISLAVRGHYAMPHPDFLEFADSGNAWLRGTLPATMKRAPVFSLLVAGVGHLLPVEAPERAVAEWLNAFLLPLNAALIYVIGRRWLGGTARWCAAWFLLLPVGVYCTSHVLVEPLLTTLILLTLWAVQRGSGGAYVLAAVATMTRYDAAGLIAGVFVADLGRSLAEPAATVDVPESRTAGPRPLRRSVLFAALAATPLVAWLILTAVTWQTRSEDHYLLQVVEQPVFAPGWAAALVPQVCFAPDLLQVPAWKFLPEELQRYSEGGTWLVGGLAVLGLVVQLWRKDPTTLAAVVSLGLYLLVHGAFPFKSDRFGYPAAPFFVLLVGVGLQAICQWLRPRLPGRAIGTIVLTIAGLLFAIALIDEGRALGTAAVGPNRLLGRIALLALASLAIIWAAPLLRARRWPQVVVFLGAALVLIIQLQRTAALLGSGDELKNQVEAARWVREHVPATARVVSASPGLLRLYAGYDPPDRFLGFQDIRATDWPDILAECRQRHIDYIIWHNHLWEEHGGYYAGKWRLDRFDTLKQPDAAPGVAAERWFTKHPDLVILRVLPADRPTTASQP